MGVAGRDIEKSRGKVAVVEEGPPGGQYFSWGPVVVNLALVLCLCSYELRGIRREVSGRGGGR